MGTLPDAWRKSNAIQREILIELYLEGPASGARIHELRGEPPSNESTTHRNIVALRERGLVESSDDDSLPGKGKQNSLTDEGRDVVDAYRDVINA